MYCVLADESFKIYYRIVDSCSPNLVSPQGQTRHIPMPPKQTTAQLQQLFISETGRQNNHSSQILYICTTIVTTATASFSTCWHCGCTIMAKIMPGIICVNIKITIIYISLNMSVYCTLFLTSSMQTRLH